MDLKKNYAAIKFGYKFTNETRYNKDKEKGIQSYRNKFHKGQRFFPYKESRQKIDLIAFYKNEALSFKKTTSRTDLKLFLKNKRQGYKAVNFDNNDTFHIRNLILENSDILKVLKDNDEIEYGCLGIRADLYESQSVEMGNFSFLIQQC